MVKESSYFAHGKLMLMGEFFVLRGATCISAPSVYGQSLQIKEADNTDTLSWKASILGDLWFTAEYSVHDFEVIASSDNFLAESFARLIRITRELNPSFLRSGAAGETNLTFPQSWGLGSSSTITKLLADWANVNPFDIHFATSNGSGYDIASSIASKPILYKCINEEPDFDEVELPSIVKTNCYFVYLGKKQSSQKSVKLFLQRGPKDLPVERINTMNLEFLKSSTVKDVCQLMKEHDEILSPILDLKRVKEVAFSSFEGEVKSLGAWGGDFVMACTEHDHDYVVDYFTRKGLDSIFRYNELLL